MSGIETLSSRISAEVISVTNEVVDALKTGRGRELHAQCIADLADLVAARPDAPELLRRLQIGDQPAGERKEKVDESPYMVYI